LSVSQRLAGRRSNKKFPLPLGGARDGEDPMSNYSPDFTPQQIAAYLAEYGIATVSAEEIVRPTGDFVCCIYAGLLSFLDPLGNDDDEHIDFDALDVVENPDYHSESIRISNFYRKIRIILASIKVELELRDLLRPDPVRTVAILSTVLNFLMYRDEKLANLQPFVDQCNYDRQSELEAKIAELKREFVEHEIACEKEKPVVQELEAEVRVLKQTILDRNKEQAGLQTHYKRIKEKIDATNNKV
ncbi:hypothetical protein Taro_025490, partial [Colocasia esculenta]|nr:hypothetical protein [Colocasia esculenta]